MKSEGRDEGQDQAARPERMRDRLGPPALLVAIVTLYWQPSWSAGVGRADFPGHVALLTTLARQLEEGPWFPLWTSDWNSGASLLFWYIQPLFSSYLLLPFVSLFGPVAGIRIGGTFFLVLAALAMYGLGRSLGGARSAGFLAALFYVLHPSVASFVGQVGQIHQPIALAILPLLFWSWLRFARAPGIGTGLAASVTAALLFYDMERFWLTAPWAFLMYLIVATRRLRGDEGLAIAPASLRAALPALAAGAGMTLLVAFPTLPAWFERPLLQWHDLTTLDVFRQYYSFPHGFALLDRAGSLADVFRSAPAVPFAAQPGQWYQGIVALVFVAGGCVLARGRMRTRGPLLPSWFAGFYLGALALAFGVHATAGLHLRLMRATFARELGAGEIMLAMLALVCLLALIGGLAFSAMPRLRNERGELRRGALALFGVAIAALLFARPFVWLSESLFLYEHLRAPSHFAFPALALLLGIAAALVTPVWSRIAGPRFALAGVAVVAVLHLLDVWPYRFSQEWSYPESDVAAWQDAFDALGELPPGRVLDSHHYNPMTDMLVAEQASHSMAWGWLSWTSTREIGDLVKTGFFDTMRLARQRQAGREANAMVAASLAGLVNVRYVTQLEGISPAMPASSFFRTVIEGPGVRIHENTLALPRLQFYEEVARVEGDVAQTVPLTAALAQRGVAAIHTRDLPDDDRIVPTFEGAPGRRTGTRTIDEALARPMRPGREVRAPCSFERPRSSRIDLDCDFSAPGVLVVAEAWFPGWQVEVAGHEQPALRLQHALMGTPVRPGPQRISFVYRQGRPGRPGSTTKLALSISAVAWSAAILLGGANAIARVRASRQSRS